MEDGNNSRNGIRTQRLIYFGTAIFVILIGTAIWSANSGRLIYPFNLYRLIPFGDKVVHFLMIGLLAFLINLSLKNRKVSIGQRKWLAGSIIVACLITLEEFSQMFIPSRNLDCQDMAANLLGICFIGPLATWFKLKPDRPVQEPVAEKRKRAA